MTAIIIRHDYRLASENPGQYRADECRRQAVTAQWLWEHPDTTGWIYDKEADDFGLDYWREIVGVDCLVDNSKIILETGRTGERLVDPTFQVFVSRKATAAELAMG